MMNKTLSAVKLDHCLCYNGSLQSLSYLITEIIHSGSAAEILEQSLFLPKLFSSGMLNRLDEKMIWQIYSLLDSSCHQENIRNNITISRCAAMAVLDPAIKDNVRALFWHYFMHRKPPGIHYPGIIFFNTYLKVRLYTNGINCEDCISFIDNNVLAIGDFRPLPLLCEAIQEDNPSRFAIYLNLEDEKISRNMLNYLLRKNAAKCFNILLETYPKTVCRVRKKEAWLFVVCMNCSGKTAVSIIRAFEKIYPGICSETRDPWNHNLLFLTTLNRNKDIFVLQKELIDLGCDPDEKNDLGLSFNLLMENMPEKWESELGLCVES